MKTLLWLDDVRNPMSGDWLVFSPIPKPYKVVWVKSYRAFTKWITKNGLPTGICFDHDLGEDEVKGVKGVNNKKVRQEKRLAKSGYDCAKWLVEYCMDNKVSLPEWNIQSANPVGKENINELLCRYARFCQDGE